jgi:cytochrome c biogenesis protein CcmG/thiol:disulfide interchange protein DsbE
MAYRKYRGHTRTVVGCTQAVPCHPMQQKIPMNVIVQSERRRALLRLMTLMGAGPALSHAESGASLIKGHLLTGQAFSTDELKGKVVLINFWASWCGPCRTEMPEIEAYYRQHRAQGLEVLAMSMDELADEGKVREAVKPFTFPVAMFKSAQLSGFGRIWRMPVSAVMDRQGRLVKQDWFIQPKLDAAALDAVIKPLL